MLQSTNCQPGRDSGHGAVWATASVPLNRLTRVILVARGSAHAVCIRRLQGLHSLMCVRVRHDISCGWERTRAARQVDFASLR